MLLHQLTKIYRTLAPELFRDVLYSLRINSPAQKWKNRRMKQDFLTYAAQLKELDNPARALIPYIQKNGITTFPYSDMNLQFPIEVKTDKKLKLDYAIFEGKKLYFKAQTTKKANKAYLIGLMNEQLPHSPHRYLARDFNVDENTILADVGCAEGNFSLSVVERVKKIYLFESDPDWIPSLEATFAPWKEKVHIINAFVSDQSNPCHISIDEFFKDKAWPNFLKLDVEGYESAVLAGASQLLAQAHLQVAMCTYHQLGDDYTFEQYFKARNFKTSFSDRWMFFLGDVHGFKAPFLRKGVLRSVKSPS
jgi:hypothetical protein